MTGLWGTGREEIFGITDRREHKPEIPSESSLLSMYTPVIRATILALLLCVLVSGCTSDFGDKFLATPTPVQATFPETVPTMVPTTQLTIETTITPAPTTEPVQVLPPERQVNLVLTKDRPTSEIHLLFQGGPGEIYINRVMMRVYTSDTVYTEYIMSKGSKPLPGDEIVAPGTRSGDRCEVFVISAGARYKVMDEKVYGGMYY